jgi:hypothetical protein
LLKEWQGLIDAVVQRHASAADGAGETWANAIAQDFLRLCALALWSWSWCLLASASGPAVQRWQRLHQAWWQWVMPDWLRCQSLLLSNPQHLPEASQPL